TPAATTSRPSAAFYRPPGSSRSHGCRRRTGSMSSPGGRDAAITARVTRQNSQPPPVHRLKLMVQSGLQLNVPPGLSQKSSQVQTSSAHPLSSNAAPSHSSSPSTTPLPQTAVGCGEGTPTVAIGVDDGLPSVGVDVAFVGNVADDPGVRLDVGEGVEANGAVVAAVGVASDDDDGSVNGVEPAVGVAMAVPPAGAVG